MVETQRNNNATPTNAPQQAALCEFSFAEENICKSASAQLKLNQKFKKPILKIESIQS